MRSRSIHEDNKNIYLNWFKIADSNLLLHTRYTKRGLMLFYDVIVLILAADFRHLYKATTALQH